VGVLTWAKSIGTNAIAAVEPVVMKKTPNTLHAQRHPTQLINYSEVTAKVEDPRPEPQTTMLIANVRLLK